VCVCACVCVCVCVSVTLSGNSPTGQTPQQIFTVDSLKDADLRKDVPEEIQAVGNAGVEILLKLCQRCWREERFSQLWTKSVVVPIHKKKVKLSCDNYRGVSLLSHCGKVMTSIILQRIRQRTEEILSEAQAGFRAGRSTIFCLLLEG